MATVVAKASAEKLIPVTLEQGGEISQHCVPDANIEKALEGIIISIFLN
ncbi:hypothetical protein PROVRUST_06845 [Providencia rustigianii DSM 4541]|uniref:Uncharacterized protein n=1 Tax=Providencia rustigianii DSM 4541 TaxID=500637 RepID=D1P3H4_9GAMM|nr:hypothetical protein PROVRUST_06845 [Providencia rustigianii DSM 4541]